MDKEVKKVYRYWLSKQDNQIHKEIAFVKLINMNGHMKYVIWNEEQKSIGDIEKEEFEQNMLKRSVAQAIYLYKEDDELAKKHYKWAISEKIKDAKETLDKYLKIKAELK